MPRYRHRRRQSHSLIGLWIALGVLGGLVFVLLIVLLITMDKTKSPSSNTAQQPSGGVENLFGTSPVDDGSPVLISQPQFLRNQRGKTLLRMNYEIKRREDLPEAQITVLMESGQRGEFSAHLYVPWFVDPSELSDRGTFDLPIFDLEKLPSTARFPDGKLYWHVENRRISNVLIVPIRTGPGSIPTTL